MKAARTITHALTLSIFSLASLFSFASTAADSQKSYSVAQTKSQSSKEKALDTIKKNINAKHTDQQLNKTQYLTREQHQKQKHLIKEAKLAKQFSSATHGTLNNYAAKSARSDYYSFSIYQGYAQLIEDFDEDGYFQTFSVTFDADAITTSYDDQFEVYAELYLSKNGGPWMHYYSTDNFIIDGESEDDIYEVYTTLDQGYPSDQYDVLIDLYEVGYDDIMASYSSNDTNDLYALPLESSDYDPTYSPVYIVEEHHGGSSSVFMITALFTLLLIRSSFKKQEK